MAPDSVKERVSQTVAIEHTSKVIKLCDSSESVNFLISFAFF